MKKLLPVILILVCSAAWASGQWLRQSTATTILIGPFIDDTDFKSAETALDVTAIDCDIYKGATKTDLTLTASGGDNDCAYVANGFYSLELTAGNTDTVGPFIVSASASGALLVWDRYDIVKAGVYDAKVLEIIQGGGGR